MGSQDVLGETLAEMNRRIEALERRALTIPVLDTDPDVNDSVTFWAFNDGRLRRRMADGSVKQYLPDSVSGSSTSTVPLPADPTPTATYDEVFLADWAATYSGDGTYRETGASLPYGMAGGAESQFGLQKVMISFESAVAALDGSEIQDVELIVDVLSTAGSSGTTMYFGTHAATSQPATYENLSVNNFRLLSDTRYTVRCRLSSSFGEQLRDSEIQGFVIDQPNDSRAYAGVISKGVYLRVVYVK